MCDFSQRAECVPAFTCESERGPFVSEVEKRFELEVVPVTFWRYSRERSWAKSRTLQEGFSSGEGRSILAQDKGPQSLMRAARPQSPAVRGFQRFQDRSRFARLNRKTAVKGEQDTPLVPITADFSR